MSTSKNRRIDIIIVVVILVLVLWLILSTPKSSASPIEQKQESNEVLLPAPASSSAPSMEQPQQTTRDYVFYQGLDSGGNDIRQDESQDNIEELKKQCDKEPKCIGFNTNGWLKQLLNPFSKWVKWTDEPNKGFYRLKTSAIPEEPYSKNCKYQAANGLTWSSFGYNNTEIAKIDAIAATEKAKYCEIGGNCFDPTTGGAWCFKPENGYATNEYVKTVNGGIWAADKFTCDGAVGRNVTGNNNDYANYCIFNTQTDAQTYCNSDAQCKGIIAADKAFAVTRDNPVVNTVANGSFYLKPGAQVKLI